jgi:hypothetical protein
VTLAGVVPEDGKTLSQFPAVFALVLDVQEVAEPLEDTTTV